MNDFVTFLLVFLGLWFLMDLYVSIGRMSSDTQGDGMMCLEFVAMGFVSLLIAVLAVALT